MWSPHFDSTNFMTEAFPRAVRNTLSTNKQRRTMTLSFVMYS